MAGNLKKFVNPRFIKTIDLALMKPLLARHEGKYKSFSVDLLDQELNAAREALEKLLTGAEDSYPEGLRGDLHRIAELGDARGLEIIQAQADRQGIDLFPDMKTGDEDAPNKAHDPKHIAVRVFLEHPDLFDAAADHMAMLTADRLHEYAGRERGVAIDLTEEKIGAFRAAVATLFRDAFLGDYCRVGDYDDDDEINLVVSHGSMVSTMPVVEGQVERVISVRQISHAVLRYSENTGMLRLARIRKAHQPEIAELFASIILDRPGFFDGDDAQDLYTLRPVELAGPGFVFDVAYDPLIDKVLIIEAAADLIAPWQGGPSWTLPIFPVLPGSALAAALAAIDGIATPMHGHGFATETATPAIPAQVQQDAGAAPETVAAPAGPEGVEATGQNGPAAMRQFLDGDREGVGLGHRLV